MRKNGYKILVITLLSIFTMTMTLLGACATNGEQPLNETRNLDVIDSLGVEETDIQPETTTQTTESSVEASAEKMNDSEENQNELQVDPESENQATPQGNTESENQVKYAGKVIEVREESLLIASDEAGLMDVGVSNANITENEEIITLDHMLAGMAVEVTYDGMVLESYPGQIFASQIKVEGREDDLVGLYLDILKEIYEIDSGLNGDITMVAIDLEKVENLSKAEKEAIMYEAWTLFDKEVIEADYEYLKENGYLTDDGMYFENGVLLSIATKEVNADSFKFRAQKWRSGLGAIFYEDCKAEKKEGKYSYELGGFAIS